MEEENEIWDAEYADTPHDGVKETSEFWPAEGSKQSHGIDSGVALAAGSPSHTIPVWQGGRVSLHGAEYSPKNWQKMPLKEPAGQILCPNSLSLEMPANIAYMFWLWSLTLKFRNSRQLGRIQQPVCQLAGTEDVASKLLSPIHVPGSRGNTNTLEACEFKLTFWHGLQNTWSYWRKREERRCVKEECAAKGQKDTDSSNTVTVK